MDATQERRTKGSESFTGWGVLAEDMRGAFTDLLCSVWSSSHTASNNIVVTIRWYHKVRCHASRVVWMRGMVSSMWLVTQRQARNPGPFVSTGTPRIAQLGTNSLADRAPKMPTEGRSNP